MCGDKTMALEPLGNYGMAGVAHRRSHEEMIHLYSSSHNSTAPNPQFAPHAWEKLSMVDHDRVTEVFQLANENRGDRDYVYQLEKEITPYILDKAWSIELLIGYSFTL